jgi:hypothetical protein
MLVALSVTSPRKCIDTKGPCQVCSAPLRTDFLEFIDLKLYSRFTLVWMLLRGEEGSCGAAMGRSVSVARG